MFASGRGRIINILLSVYVAKLIVLEMPFWALPRANWGYHPSRHCSSWRLCNSFFGAVLFLGRFALKTSADSRHLVSMIFGLIFAFLQIGLLINIILSYLPAGTQQSFSPLIQTILLPIRQVLFGWFCPSLIWLSSASLSGTRTSCRIIDMIDKIEQNDPAFAKATAGRQDCQSKIMSII